jgi:hypothetical protein
LAYRRVLRLANLQFNGDRSTIRRSGQYVDASNVALHLAFDEFQSGLERVQLMDQLILDIWWLWKTAWPPPQP